MIRLRFVASNDITSRLIRFQAGVSMPFTPSHVEALTVDGKEYIGAHIDGGIRARPVGYDAASLMTLSDGYKSERIVSLRRAHVQKTARYTPFESAMCARYESKARLGFEMPDFHLHEY